MRKLILIAILFASQQVCAQNNYEIIDISEKTYQESGALTSGEIQIINYSGVYLQIDCSVNNKSWTSKSLKNKGGIEVHVTSDVYLFYVKYCNSENATVQCDNYRLTPGRRYIFRYSTTSGKVALKKAAD